MKGIHKKTTALGALMLAGLMLLCGCGSSVEAMPEMDLSSYVP